MTLTRPDPQAMVIFGASGDLTARKIMPALFNLHMQGLLPKGFAVIGYSRSTMSDDEFSERMREAVNTHSRTQCDIAAWKDFSRTLRYVSGEFASERAMSHLAAELERADKELGTEGRRLYYCATPPLAFPQIAARIGEENLAGDSRIVIEKPFGEDLKTAIELNRVLHDVFDEDQILRIDHYLGKETVQNILVFRFSNGMFEPIWNRRHIEAVEIDVAESIGIGSRAQFYESAGAIRDVAQNHMLQLLAILGMEPPASFDAESIRDEKVKLLKSVPPADHGAVVRGQYGPGEMEGGAVPGYREEEGVAPDSITETLVAMKLRVDNWRWAGVPFYLRTGKRMPRRATEINVMFRDAPHLLFADSGLQPPPQNHLTIRIQPDEGISLTFDAKIPGPEMKVTAVKMDFNYSDSFMLTPAMAYERLLHDAMDGEHTLFTRADEVERSWMIVEQVLERREPEIYPAGTWGPKGIDDLIAPYRWHLR